MANPKTQFQGKEFEDLSNLQQDIITEVAENPDLIDREIADKLDCSRQYVTGARTGAEEIIEEIRDEDELDAFFKDVESPGDSNNADGKVRTENGIASFEGEPIDLRGQRFHERPNKNQLTDGQLEFVDGLDASELEKRIIRLKLRNPDLNPQEMAEALEEKIATVSTYLSKNRENIQEAFSIPHRQDSSDDGHHKFSFSDDEIIDILSSDTNREVKKKIIERITD